MRLRGQDLAAALLGLSAFACGDPSRPLAPVGPTSGSTSGTSGSAAPHDAGPSVDGAAGGTGAADGGAPGDSAGDGAAARQDAGDAAADDAPADDAPADDAPGNDDAGDGGPAPPAPLCPTGAVWADGTLLAISTGADQFGAVTPDEKTIVWTSIPSGGTATIYYADRTDPATPFANPTALTLSSTDFIAGPLAISPDGLQLALEAPDTTFFAVTRSDRGATFDPTASTAEFAALNGEIFASEAVVTLGDPVYGAGGQTFVYSRFPAGGAQGISTIFEAPRAGDDPWSDGTPLNGDPIEETDSEVRRRPTGISADERTLFYWDDAAGGEMMAWRGTTDDTFANPLAIGPRSGAKPNAACTAIYYSAATASGTGLFVASLSRTP